MLAIRARYPLMALGLIALIVAMWSGLVRLGWGLPPLSPSLPGAHGALMVGGFLGTLIGLERAVALSRKWAYVAPLLSGLGGLALLVGLPWPFGPALLALGSLWLVVVYAAVLRMQLALFTATMALGAVAWACGNLLWLGGLPIYQAVLWWAGFLILTIAGERLELTRMLPRSSLSKGLFLAAAGLFLAGLGMSVVLHDLGVRVLGTGLAGLAVWLLRYDIARRTVRQRGLTRYIAGSLLLGYVWLGVAGIFGMAFGAVYAGPHYDALLHSIFLGFVFSMIFAHAPVIIPAVVGAAVPFRQAFYAHLALLHISLALRISGDLLDWIPGRQWGGMLNVFALLLFMLNTGLAIAYARRKAVATNPSGRRQRTDTALSEPSVSSTKS